MLSRRKFLLRLLGHALVALIIVGGSLLLGIWGFMAFCEMTAIDALLNATMLLGGMGPVGAIATVPVAGKLFASFYALYAGLVFLILAGVLLARCCTGFCIAFTWRWWIRIHSPGAHRRANRQRPAPKVKR